MKNFLHLTKALYKPLVTSLVLVSIILLPMVFLVKHVSASEPVEVGYRDFTFPSGTGGNSEPTGEKPESKLWWNDGFWWGSLWSSAGNTYRIHRFDLPSQSWVDTGVAMDNRKNSRADALWDGNFLYVASHVFAKNAGQPTSSAERGRLYRYSYNTSTKTYSLDAGFPVEITGGKSETLVIDKDSKGQLWVTYVESQKVMVNRSLNGDDRTWGQPFALPFPEANVASDDISSVIAYSQHVGVMWSNQNSPKTMYFATHPANSPDDVWTRVRAYTISGDDHINLKQLDADDAGNVFAAIKTSKSSELIKLLVCKNNLNRCKTESDWEHYTVYNSSSGSPTRPMLLIDTSNRHLYVFTRNKDSSGNSGIYYKRSNLDGIVFPSGIGTAFIKSATDTDINDPTSTKQNLNNTTGMLVLASDGRSKYYLHNYMSLGSGPPPGNPPVIQSFSPTSGPVGSEVTITGSNFTGASQVAFNGTPSTSFVVDSSSQIRAIVPVGATSGPISVTNASGTGASAGSFTVTTSTKYMLSITINGSGSVGLSPTGGSYDPGTIVTLTATAASGWSFSGWSGDLTGSSNPATITMDANKSVTATFQQASSGGVVNFAEAVGGGSSGVTTVSTGSAVTAVSGDLYLAAISARPNYAVNSVTGLGLSWTLVTRQCSGRNQIGIEVWMAQGTPGGNGPVTAQFSRAPSNAVILVSRYANVSGTNPIGNILSGNTVGVNGACSGGVDSGSYSFSIPTGVNAASVYGAAAMRTKSHTPGEGYTERAEIRQGSSGAVASVAIQDKSISQVSTVVLNGSFSGSVDWAVIGIEIRPK